jgi:hypothetical protein
MNQDGAGTYPSHVSTCWHQDGASAPTPHPNSPRPYAMGIEHPIIGRTLRDHTFAKR